MHSIQPHEYRSYYTIVLSIISRIIIILPLLDDSQRPIIWSRISLSSISRIMTRWPLSDNSPRPEAMTLQSEFDGRRIAKLMKKWNQSQKSTKILFKSWWKHWSSKISNQSQKLTKIFSINNAFLFSSLVKSYSRYDCWNVLDVEILKLRISDWDMIDERCQIFKCWNWKYLKYSNSQFENIWMKWAWIESRINHLCFCICSLSFQFSSWYFAFLHCDLWH